MLHARADYNRIQDLAGVCNLMMDMAIEYVNQGKIDEAMALRRMVEKIEKRYNFDSHTTVPIPDSEPVFLLRASDKVAAYAVRVWGQLASLVGADVDILQKANDHSFCMDDWPVKNIPDLPGGGR